MFLSNDPWVGAAHQMDVTLLCPVFWEGKLFCWITNVLHQYDVGGITPGSFCPNARDAFDEGILIPPVKIIERGELRRDIEAVYLRASRKPYLVALDLRAQIAGNVAAGRRIVKLIERYGPDVVKGVMRKIIDTAEAAFLQKMAKLPDGTLRERTYVEVARVGDRGTYQVLLTMQKHGDRLVFDNAGTAPQTGAINTTYSGWRGSILTAINELLCWDQLYAIGGALRHIEFRPAMGAFTSATHPASVTTAPVQAMEISLYPAYNTLSKMLAGHPELKKDVMCIGGTSQFPLTCFRGIDQWGERFGYLLLDPMVGAIGAFSFRDGIATGGQVRSPICRIGNVEHNEQSFPILTLYRRENTDSGGAGKYRGGNSAITAFIPHGTAEMWHETESSGRRHPHRAGPLRRLSGLHQRLRVPPRHRRPRVVPASARCPATSARSAAGRSCSSFGRSTSARARPIFTRSRSRPVPPTATLSSAIPRRCGATSRAATSRRTPRGTSSGWPWWATTTTRASTPPPPRPSGTRPSWSGSGESRGAAPCATRVVHHVTEALDLVRQEAGRTWPAPAAGGSSARAAENYKAHALRIDRPIQMANPLIGDPQRFIDAAVEFRQFHCPECGGLIENEVCRAARPPAVGHSTRRGRLIPLSWRRDETMDANAKKTALRMIPYGLYVLTAETRDGRLAAATVNWVTQASFEPPLVVVGVKTGSSPHSIIPETKSFALSILGKGQGNVAYAFFKPAQREGDRIGGEPVRAGKTGSPILVNAPAAVECELVATVEQGDHAIFVGKVVEASVSTEPAGRADDATLWLKDLGEKVFYGG